MGETVGDEVGFSGFAFRDFASIDPLFCTSKAKAELSFSRSMEEAIVSGGKEIVGGESVGVIVGLTAKKLLSPTNCISCFL